MDTEEQEKPPTTAGETHRVYAYTGNISAGLSPARDGYLPCAAWLLFLAMFGIGPEPDQFRFLVSAGRRCDSAHRQFQRVRENVDALRLTRAHQPGDVERAIAAIGDIEMGATAAHRAITMAVGANKRWALQTQLPVIVQQKAAAIAQLRHAYEHIDERALGQVQGKNDPTEALSIFNFASLIERGEVTYAGERLGVYTEATELLIALRNYLAEAWAELSERCGRAQRMSGQAGSETNST